MSFAQNITQAIGKTPLIKLHRVSEVTGCTILGKAEFLNPGQSVKDRAALYIINDAVMSGKLKKGGTIVEGTAGNTGIGLAVVSAALGYKCVVVIPNTQTQEKKATLRLLGAQVVEVPAKPYSDPNNFVRYSERLASVLDNVLPNGAIWANQFDNLANRQAHIETTAAEIWEQTSGQVNGFSCAVGSGGTLAGVSMGLKSLNPDIKVAIADPPGAALHSYYTTGKLTTYGSSIAEGIGQTRITANLKGAAIDYAYLIPDALAVQHTFQLLEDEGLCLGVSSGVNVAGATHLAKELGPGNTIVTILCDYGTRYESTLFQSDFLRSNDLPVPDWLERKTEELPSVFSDVEK
ncbi:MAG: Cysteine synthase [Hyphomicrobiaceae bacterium hypho_1]